MESIGRRYNCSFTHKGERYIVLEPAGAFRPAKCVNTSTLAIKDIYSWEECSDVKYLTEREMYNVRTNVTNYEFFSGCMCFLFLGLILIGIMVLGSM
jgi:hypothetical protein